MFAKIEKVSNKYINLVVDLPDYIARDGNLVVLFNGLNSFLFDLINQHGAKPTKKYGGNFACFVICKVPIEKSEVFVEKINNYYSFIINQ